MTNLNLLESVKSEIKNALIDKQLPIFGGLTTYADSIKYSNRCPLPNGTKLSWSTFVTVPDYDFILITDMSRMFYECQDLTTIPQLDASNVEDFYLAFLDCRMLRWLGGFIGLKVSIDLHWSTLLTYESLMNVINNLAEVTTSPKLTLGETNLAKLTTEEIAIATSKGWIVN